MEAVLDATVAVANCYCLIFESLEIYCDAEGRADLILAPIALADIAVIIPDYPRMNGLLQIISNLLSFFNKLWFISK